MTERRRAILAAFLALVLAGCSFEDPLAEATPDAGWADDDAGDASDGTDGLPCSVACGDYGACDGATGTCVCDDGWIGGNCSACASGFYGQTCNPCACDHGTCTDGLVGDGTCLCDPGWVGPACNVHEAVAWSESGLGSGIMDRAADFTLPTLAGPWSLAESWTGLDSHVFFLKYADSAANTALWEGDVGALLLASPPNVHYVFGSFDETYQADIASMKARVDMALGTLADHIASHWAPRVHYIDERAFFLEGAIKAFLDAQSTYMFCIDRFQRWRQVGTLYDWIGDTYPLAFLAHEPRYFDYERRIDSRMEAMGGLEVVLFDQGEHPGGWGAGHHTDVEVTLPDAAQMEAFDSLALYLYTACPGHKQGKDEGCNEWDFIQSLSICDREKPHAQALESTSCTPPTEEEPGDSLLCHCVQPGGETVESTHGCNQSGTGWEPCACGCDGELGRWVTPYAREGRWLTEVDPLLALVRDGGERRFRFSGANGYTLDLRLLLWNAGRGERPLSATYLWGKTGGTAFDESYNDGKHGDVVVSLPPQATRAELVAVVSGHGHSSTLENCAEFCNHQHEFTLGSEVVLHEHPLAGDAYGCRDQIDDGTVPNQYGTWIYGRGGWCPGMDIKPFVADGSHLLDGGSHTLSYRGLLDGGDYTPWVTDPGGYLPEIKMTSWLVVYGPSEP